MSPISKETEDYIRESIEKSLKLKLLASEEDRRLLQVQNLMLVDRQRGFHMRFQSSKEKASMNGLGLIKMYPRERNNSREVCCSGEKCRLFERELDEYMESCAELENENDELRAKLQEASFLQATFVEVQSLRQDKKKLLKNLQRAAEENKFLEEGNKRLQRKLQREHEHRRTNYKQLTGDSSSRDKRKSRDEERGIHLDEGSRQQPHSPVYQNFLLQLEFFFQVFLGILIALLKFLPLNPYEKKRLYWHLAK